MKPIRKTASAKSFFRIFQFMVMAVTISLFSAAAMAEKVNLNEADAETLQYIPGVGPSKANDIIKIRLQNGGFNNFEQLLEVPGIGEKTLEDIKRHGTLEGGVSTLTEEMQANPPAKKASTVDSEQSQTSG